MPVKTRSMSKQAAKLETRSEEQQVGIKDATSSGNPPHEDDESPFEDAYGMLRDSVLFSSVSPPAPFKGLPGDDFRDWLKRFNRWA